MLFPRRFPRLASVLLSVLPAVAVSAAPFAVRIATPAGEPAADAVVSLHPLDRALPAAGTLAPVEIVQQAQEFLPYVTVVQVGTPVVFPNRDTVQHHVYSLSKPKKFELPLYDPGKAETVVFDQPGLVTLGCNIHDWMISHVVVVATPWFAKTDGAGAATIDAPPGRYRVEIWHPRAAVQTRETAIDAGGSTQAFSLALKPDRRVRRSGGAKGGGY